MKKIPLFVTLLLLAALVCSPAAFALNVPTVQWNSASGHVHDFSACVAEADYLYSAATYESPALYYKSCSCGLSSVGTLYEAFFEDGRPGDGYYSVVSRKDWDIAPGIKESEIVLNEASGTRRQVMRVMEVDTSDPYVSVLPSYMGMNPTPGNYRTAPMTEQAVWVRDNMGLNVVGGMNTCLTWYDSDFYLENPHLIGEPLGILIIDGQIYSRTTTGEDGQLYAENTSPDTCIVINYDVKDGVPRPSKIPKVQIRLIASPITGWEEQVVSCNFGYLVKNGKVNKSVNHENQASKSTLGIKADGTIVMMQNDGRQAPFSSGMSTYEIAVALKKLGCVHAVRCDGGGSSTFLSRRPGEELRRQNTPSDGSERPTTSGILVISNAPSTGEFARAVLSADHEYYAPGCTVSFAAVGADIAGTAAAIPADVEWDILEPGMGSIENGVFVSNGTTGKVTVRMLYKGKVVGQTGIQIVKPTAFRFRQAVITVPYGRTVGLRLVGTVNKGLNTVVLNPADISFETTNPALGSFDGLRFTAVPESELPASLTSTVTATLHCTGKTAKAKLNLGKPSEVLDDMEAGIDGWNVKLTGAECDYEVRRVTQADGLVHDGSSAMGVFFNNKNHKSDALSYSRLILSPKEPVYVKNGDAVGAWVYVPDDFYNLWVEMRFYTQDADGEYTVENIESPLQGGDVYTSFEGSGWHYLSCDISGHENVMLGDDFIRLISQHCSANDLFQTTGSPHGRSLLYIDTVTVDYSAAADDSQAPVFGDIKLIDGEAETLLYKHETAVTANNVLHITAAVADDAAGTNATGLNEESAQAYIDGVSVTAKYLNGLFTISNAAVSNGTHRVKFEISDMMGNRSQVTRLIRVESAVESSTVEIVPADPALDRLYGGSVYWMNVNATMLQTVQSVSFDIDLNATNHWELDHMVLAEGFSASHTVDEATNTATVTLTRTGENTLAGKQLLAALPIRVGYYDTDIALEGYTAETFWNQYYFWPQDVKVNVERGAIEYIRNYSPAVRNTFSSPAYAVDTEMYTSAQHMDAAYKVSRGTAHVHTERAVEDVPAFCTTDGLVGHTFCDVCDSPVQWGTVLPAFGHDYVSVGGVMTCSHCGELLNGEHEGKFHIDGVIADGWITRNGSTYYYTEGVMVVGSYIIDGTMHTFGLDGRYDPNFAYTGFYQTQDGYMMYFVANAYVTGYHRLQGGSYYFDENGIGYEGEYTLCGETCRFDNGMYVGCTTADLLDAGLAGESAEYVIYADGTMVLEGSGDTFGFENHGNRPFIDYTGKIRTLKIGAGIKLIGLYFMSYSNVEKVVYAENCTLREMHKFSFYECDRLKALELPKSMEIVDYAAFGKCSKLEKVTVTSPHGTIHKTAFTECPEALTLYVKANSSALRFAQKYAMPYVIDEAHVFTAYTPNNDATCTQVGTETARCKNGCAVYDTRPVAGEAPGHRYETYVYNGDAACTADGTETAVCENNCGIPDTRTAEGSRLGHDFVGYTDNGDGTQTGHCSRCNQPDTLPDGVDPEAPGCPQHIFDTYVYNEDATCFANGTETAVCDRAGCGETDTRTKENSALTHSFTVYRYNNDAAPGVDGTETALCDHGCGTPHTRTAAGTALPTVPTVTGSARIFGNSRYETSFGIANEYKAVLGVEKFESVIIASGVNFPDALAGSYLAAIKNAPILMAKVANGQLLNGAELKSYLDANLAAGGKVYVLGGQSAIPYTLEDALSGLSVKRLQGNSRYETNIEILNEAGITGDTLLVCTGKGYADALSASASGLPILLVDGEGTLKDVQKDFLRQHSFRKIYILGGPVAVNEGYDGVLAGYANTVTRLAGANRRATSVLVAETFFTAPDAAVIAYSKNFPDGLCGGPLANALGAPILLTETAAPLEAINYARAVGINAGYVLGGSGLVSDDAVKAILNTPVVATK